MFQDGSDIPTPMSEETARYEKRDYCKTYPKCDQHSGPECLSIGFSNGIDES